MLNSEIISQIRSANKYIQDDNLITDRFIYRLAKTKAALLLKRELSQRKLGISDNVFQQIECLELIETNGTECDISQTVARSKYRLPQIEEGLYSYFIQGVFNIDNSEEIYPTSMREFINNSKLRVKSNKSYYIIKDRYLYVLNPDVKAVNLYAYFTETIVEQPECMSMYDREFKLPPYLLDGLFSLCNEALINYHKLPVDTEDDNKPQT